MMATGYGYDTALDYTWTTTTNAPQYYSPYAGAKVEEPKTNKMEVDRCLCTKSLWS